jgi:hypothetical protein
MSNVDVRPVRLQGNQITASPRKLPMWSPPGQELFFDKKRMGQKKPGDGFSSENVPKSLAFALGGAGGILIGTKVPAPISGILIGAGLISIGYGVYALFSKEEAPGGLKTEATGSQITDKETFDAVTGKFLSPKMYEETSYWANADANLLLSNPSGNDAEFTLIVSQYELERGWWDNWKSNPSLAKFNYEGKIVENPVRIGAGDNQSVKLSIDSDTVWPTAIKLVAEKVRVPQEAPVKLAEVIFFG